MALGHFVRHSCGCVCHHAPDEPPPPFGVVMLDALATYTACSLCANEHWRAFYLATEPEAPQAPKPPADWVDPPRSQADGWQSE